MTPRKWDEGERDETDHIDWDDMAEKRLGQSEHGRHLAQPSPVQQAFAQMLAEIPALAGATTPNHALRIIQNWLAMTSTQE